MIADNMSVKYPYGHFSWCYNPQQHAKGNLISVGMGYAWQRFFDSFTACSVSGRYMRKEHVLQSSLHFGPETGSSTTVPSSHSGQVVTRMRMKLWGHPV